MILLEYNGKQFKPYDSRYYVSEDGDIYSTYKNGLLKHNINPSGRHMVDIHGRHMGVHRLVYLTWNGDIPSDKQINHRDDNKENNCASNLYLGSQKENIRDCVNNGHRVGHVKAITVYDKMIDETIEFPSIKEFLDYTGHSISNGSITHCINKRWFKERFDIVGLEGVTTIESYKSKQNTYSAWVENKAATHEASKVG